MVRTQSIEYLVRPCTQSGGRSDDLQAVRVSPSDKVGGGVVANRVLVAVVLRVVRRQDVVPDSDPVERPPRPVSQPLVGHRVRDEHYQRQRSSVLEIQQ